LTSVQRTLHVNSRRRPLEEFKNDFIPEGGALRRTKVMLFGGGRELFRAIFLKL